MKTKTKPNLKYFTDDWYLKIPYTPPVECDKELCIVIDIMEDMRNSFRTDQGEIFEYHGKKGNNQRIARVLTEVCESLTSGELTLSIDEEDN